MRAINDGVFARGGDDLEFFTQIATNGATVSGHRAVAQAKTVKNAAIGGCHILVAGFGAVGVFVKAIRIFHDELTPAHQAKAGAAFIAKFGLNLIQIFRQLFIAFEFLAGNISHHFFAGGLNDEVAPVPILNTQQLWPHFFKAARFLPQLGGLHHRHGQLNGARFVHLFADDGFNLADDAQTQGHIVVNARPQFFDHARTGHELVADDFGVGRRFFERGNQKLRSFHGFLLGFIRA